MKLCRCVFMQAWICVFILLCSVTSWATQHTQTPISLPCVKIPDQWAILSLPDNKISDFTNVIASLTGVSKQKAQADLLELNKNKIETQKSFAYYRVTKQTSRALFSQYAVVIQKYNRTPGCGKSTRPARILILPEKMTVANFIASLGVRSRLAYRLLIAEVIAFNPGINFLEPGNLLQAKQLVFLPQSFPFNVKSLQNVAKQKAVEQAQTTPSEDSTSDKYTKGYETSGLYIGAEIGQERIVLRSSIDATSATARATSQYAPRIRGVIGYDYLPKADNFGIEAGIASRSYDFYIDSSSQVNLDIPDLNANTFLLDARFIWRNDSHRLSGGIAVGEVDMLVLRRSSFETIRIFSERVITFGPFVKVTRGNPQKATVSIYAHPQGYSGSSIFTFDPGYVLAGEIAYNTAGGQVYFGKFTHTRAQIVESGFRHEMDIYAFTFGMTFY